MTPPVSLPYSFHSPPCLSLPLHRGALLVSSPLRLREWAQRSLQSLPLPHLQQGANTIFSFKCLFTNWFYLCYFFPPPLRWQIFDPWSKLKVIHVFEHAHVYVYDFIKIQENIFGLISLCSKVSSRRSLWAGCFWIRCQNNNTNWTPNSDYNVITSSSVSFGPYSSTRLPNFPSVTSEKRGDNISTFPLWQTLLHCLYLKSETAFFPSLPNNQLLSVNSSEGCLIYVALDNKVQYR